MDRGKDAGYNGECYPELAPLKSFWRTWKDNIGKISEQENNRYYIEEYWKQVLSKLDVEKVYRELDYSTLLCYENNNEFCHRHIVAAWFELLLDVKVPEVIIKNFELCEVERPTFIKKYLENAIKKTKDMHGFTSLRALFLFEKSEELERKANELENKIGRKYDQHLNLSTASLMRCAADLEEEQYQLSKKKIYKKTF